MADLQEVGGQRPSLADQDRLESCLQVTGEERRPVFEDDAEDQGIVVHGAARGGDPRPGIEHFHPGPADPQARAAPRQDRRNVHPPGAIEEGAHRGVVLGHPPQP